MRRRWLLVLPLLLLLLSSLHAEQLASAYQAMRLGDFGQAATLFKQQADKGSAEAQYQLGKLYLAGRGVDKNTTEAGKWLEKSATAGNAGAQFTLGLLERDAGNQQQAQHWLQQALDNGYGRARSELDKLAVSERPLSPKVNPEKLQQQWFDAALKADVDLMTALLEAGAKINSTDDYQRNALYYLVADDNEQGVQWLLAQGIDSNNADKYGETALILAVRQAEDGIIRRLLAAGADPAVTSRSGDGLAHLAVKGGEAGVLALLLKASVPINAANATQQTPLDLAVIKQDARLVSMIERQGGRHSPKWQAPLAPEGASMAAYLDSKEGPGPWPQAKQAVLQDEAKLLAALLAKHGPDLAEQRDSQGNSLLIYAARGSSLAVVPVLVSAGASPDQANTEGQTALMQAATLGDTAMVNTLLLSGAAAAIQDPLGRDALQLALAAGHEATAERLLGAVVQVNRQTKAGQTYMMTAIEGGAGGLVERLLKRGARLDLADQQGRSALAYSQRYCDLAATRQLLKQASGVDASDNRAYTALHVAAGVGCQEGVDVLLAAGADINAATGEGNTALMLAARAGHSAIALRLISQGADVELQNKSGDTALLYAVAGADKPVLEGLLAQGGDPYKRNQLGDSALSLAEQQQPALVEVIREQGGFRFPGF